MARRLRPGRHTEEFVDWLERATKVFASYGINIEHVAEEGCDETGYDEFQFDGFGQRRVGYDGATIKHRKEWPSRAAALACLKIAAEKPGMP